MATKKPTKSGKKPAAKPEVTKTKEVKATKVVETVDESPVIVSTCDKPLKGFFAKKFDSNENIVTIFKTPKIWGAALGEIIGTMLVVMLFLTLGISPLYLIFALAGIYVAVVGLSGAHLNPIVTVGMMATRRMSAIRGVLYLLAQLLGGWIGLIIVNAFRLGSTTSAELPSMVEVTGESFWMVALLELLGACVIGFIFARALRYARKQPLAFGFAVTSGLTLAVLLVYVITQGFFAIEGNTYMFNPVVALMYQILPTAADSFGELAGAAGIALAAYVLFPIVGGVIGFYISDIATRLSAGGYFCECDEPCHKKIEK